MLNTLNTLKDTGSRPAMRFSEHGYASVSMSDQALKENSPSEKIRKRKMSNNDVKVPGLKPLMPQMTNNNFKRIL